MLCCAIMQNGTIKSTEGFENELRRVIKLELVVNKNLLKKIEIAAIKSIGEKARFNLSLIITK
jgi:hypothetical protein